MLRLNLCVIGNHDFNYWNNLEVGNKIKNKLSRFSFFNIEHLKELELLYHSYQYKDIDENEKVTEDTFSLFIDKNDKLGFKKEFSSKQKGKILEQAIKLHKLDEIIDANECRWEYFMYSEDSIRVDGPFGLFFEIDTDKIYFNFSRVEYKNWLHLHKIIRDEWRKYFFQIIKLFGGNKAIYIPEYFCDFEIPNHNDYSTCTVIEKDIHEIEEYLDLIYGENNKKIDGILQNEYCGYVIDDFSDILLDKNMDINDFKKYLKQIKEQYIA